MTAFTDALKGKGTPAAAKTTPFQSALSKLAPATPVNKFGQDVSTHVLNPLNPNNQLKKPQPSTSLWQNFKSSIGPTIKQGIDKVYDMAGGIIAPGITHDELRNKQILKDTVTGLPKAVYNVTKQTVTHPLDTSVTAIRSATKGISDTITNGVINVFVPKQDREKTQAQVQETLKKYLGSPDDYNPVLKGISQGFEAGGAAAPFVAAGGIAGETGVALGSATTPFKEALSQGIGSTLGFVGAGQTQVSREATVRERTDQLMNDLVGLGLFTAGSTLFHGIKGKAEVAIRESLKPKTEVVPDQVVHTTTGDKTFYTIPKDKAKTVINTVDSSPAGFTATNKIGDKLSTATKTPEQMTEQGYKFGGAISEDSIVPPKVPTKVAKSIEAKAIEKGLTDSFANIADYDPITIKSQAKLVSDLLQSDLERAKAMARGEELIPRDILGGALLKGLEDYAFAKGDVALIQDLANSPLAAETSRHAQELRILAERNPDSSVAILRDLKKTREEAALRKHGEVEKAKTNTIKEIKSEVKPIPKERWASFIDSIKC